MKYRLCLPLLLLCLGSLAGCDVTFNVRDRLNAIAATREPEPLITVPAPPPVPVPEPRPAWVDEPAGLHGGVYETKVLVGPEADRAACDAKLAPPVEAAVFDYVTREFGSDAIPLLDLRYTTLRPRVVGAVWEENVEAGEEKGTFLHAQLRFDDKLRAEWKRAVDQWTTKTRTSGVLRGFAVAMGVIFVVHLAMRFNQTPEADA